MGGARLELARFSMYIFFPTAMMLYFSDPDWYNQNVHPIRDKYLRPDLQGKKLPQTRDEITAELNRLRTQNNVNLEEPSKTSTTTNNERLV